MNHHSAGKPPGTVSPGKSNREIPRRAACRGDIRWPGAGWDSSPAGCQLDGREGVTGKGFESAGNRRCYELVQEAFEAGGSGYILKSHFDRELIPGVAAMLKGKQFVSHAIVRSPR